MDDDSRHSLDRHPLKSFDDFDQIRRDVELCRISWPIGIAIPVTDEAESGLTDSEEE